MDNTDFRIVKILQEKARIPNVEVARKIGMAPSAVLERIKKLEAQGVIEGYEVRLNPEMFDCAMIAFVKVKIRDLSRIRDAGKHLSGINQVQEVHHLAGEDCLLVKMRVSGNAQLEEILSTRIAAINLVKNTKTLIALSTYKETARVTIPEHCE